MFHVEHILRSYFFMSQLQLIFFCEIKIVLRGTINREYKCFTWNNLHANQSQASLLCLLVLLENCFTWNIALHSKP